VKPGGRLVRLPARDRAEVAFTLDGEPATARTGDTLLTAILLLRGRLSSGASDEPHAGFCLMGACQECWVTADGRPVRACGTLIAGGMRIATRRHTGSG
jgi:aerobic-type carbon monoxide dehydrogenase small subunit (CoxS/CutS family)